MGEKEKSEALRLVGLAYDAALSGQDFTHLLQQLTVSIGAKSVMLRKIDYTEKHIGFFDSVGYDPVYRRAYTDYYINLDIYRDFLETAPAGTLVLDNQLPGYEARRNSEYHNDYSKPQGMEYILGSVLARDHATTIQFGAHRNKDARNFGRSEMELLGDVLPHLARSVKMRQMLAATTHQQMLAESALDQLRVGVILADAQTRPLFVNRMAEEHLAGSCGAMALSVSGLTLRKPEATADLHRMVAEAASTTDGKGLASGGEMRIACVDGSFMQLSVVPLSRQRIGCEFAAPSACAAIFISRPGSINLPWRKVAIFYGLSQAEAKLAVQLANGKNPEAAAEHLGLSIHTVRTQLKAIFTKTGAQRQPELVTMLLQGVLGQCQTGEI